MLYLLLSFSSLFDVLLSTFKPILNLTQSFRRSWNMIFNSPLPIRLFTYFFLVITPSLLHKNLAPALKRFFSSSKFFTLIIQTITLFFFRNRTFDFQSILPRSEGIESLLFCCIIIFLLWVSSFWCNSSVTSNHHQMQGGFVLLQFQLQMLHQSLQLSRFQSTLQHFLLGSLLFTSKLLFQLLTTFQSLKYF